MFGFDPYQKTLNASDFLNFLYGETADESLIRKVASEWFDAYDEADCDSCGFSVPAIEVDDALTCMLCKTSLLKTFTVSFSFSITVKAKTRDDAEMLAVDAVSVNVDEDEKISDNYDVEMQDVDESY